MADFGLYSVNSNATLPVKGTRWERTTLMHNGVKVGITTDETDGFGARVVGDSLVMNGEVIAKSASSSAAVTADGRFGEVDLLGHHKCINITLADYNTLLNGGTVAGYKAHDPDAVYNIVENVSTAPAVYCDNPIDLTDPLYNNQPEVSLPVHQVTSATFTNMTAPHISVHGYKFVIAPGERLEVNYMVDTRTGDFTNRLTRGETFTTTIKDADGNVLYLNTTYAGVFKVKLQPFKTGDANTTGETWFSVECVDSRGVGSIVLYNDVYIKATATEKLYNMKEEDLTRFDEHITPNAAGNNTLAGYKNKVAFSKLFAAVAADPKNYTGIKLYNPTGDYTYYIDYHKNHSSTEGQYDFCSHAFYVYRKYSYDTGELDQQGNPIIAHDIDVENAQEIIQGETITIEEEDYTVDTTPLEWIKKDGAHIHRVGGTGADANKIRVRWPEDMYGTIDPSIHKYVGDAYADKSLHVFNQVTSGSYYGWSTSLLNPELRKKIPDGYYYSVINTPRDVSGDSIVFPNHFTVDMNGATWRGIECIDLHDFALIQLYNNLDTHIRNGKLQGIYDVTKIPEMFIGSSLTLGIWSRGGVFEGGRNIQFIESGFCSMTNVESVGSLGYDATTRTLTARSHIGYSGVASLGYIDNNGDIQTPTSLTELDATLNPEVGSNGHIELVYSSGYVDISGVTASEDLVVNNHNSKLELNCGKQHEVFLSFYKEVTDNGVTRKVFLDTIKTALYNAVKKPSGATHVRFSAYGVSDSGRALPTDSTTSRKIPFEYLAITKQIPIRCCSYIDCYWHDTRTIAFHPGNTKGVLYERCHFNRIANIQRFGGCQWFITHLLGDIEEDWAYCDGLVIKDCIAERTPNEVSTGNEATRAISIKGAQSFTFIGNTGFSYDEGAIQSGLVMNNLYCGLKIVRSFRYEHPCLLYRNNIVDEEGFRPFEEVKTDLSTHLKNDDGTTYRLRFNRCDDPVCTDVAMRDTLAYVPGSLTGSLTYKYHRTKLNNTLFK